jgi:transposase-like protein
MLKQRSCQPEALSVEQCIAMKSPVKPATRPKAWSEAEKRQLVKLIRDGARTPEIAARLGRHAGSVKLMARAMGLLLKK